MGPKYSPRHYSSDKTDHWAYYLRHKALFNTDKTNFDVAKILTRLRFLQRKNRLILDTMMYVKNTEAFYGLHTANF